MKKYKNLRSQAHQKILQDLKKRIVTKSRPTKEEIFLGAYVEMLEPQIRDAVREFNRKGYTTWSSGFYKNKQQVDGFFTIDPETKTQLKKTGVSILEEKDGYTTIKFSPKDKKLDGIKKQWDSIASLLPKKKRGKRSDNAASVAFRKNPLREAFYMIGEIEYMLSLKQK